MKLGELIKAWREVNGMGIRDAAKQIGVSSATLSRIENGKELKHKSFLKLFTWIIKP
jgi:transcriptional regulator with XRE-family HTH domain